ncbi:Glycine cleavage system H protein [Candidatus Rhabdochlamydia oedothoracis]|uniref:Glycine cleavage system H protein n=1 Tax=Candidatus Rhabdochlamydia oedothoracis TaxID=2720720 RepID=A0ABX8V1U6_9BACT|nr:MULTISPECIES: glycine cleavage system protein GcvH [Rhabdochlamydia]KAG6559041.1 Glycine cleavage system H protein [Candidatus Rhabdochlamydia sp. W815]QYF49213.1 Glycine cleavage system H protein [Candidatus Rhabdochlamydia oedothoracis]
MKFTESHEWIRMEDEVGTVGITHFAQKEMGEIVYVELPSIGKLVKAGQEIAVLESTKAAADIYSPVSGEVLEINEKLQELSQGVNQAAETDGWLFKVKITDKKELERLLSEEQYKEFIQ